MFFELYHQSDLYPGIYPGLPSKAGMPLQPEPKLPPIKDKIEPVVGNVLNDVLMFVQQTKLKSFPMQLDYMVKGEKIKFFAGRLKLSCSVLNKKR